MHTSERGRRQKEFKILAAAVFQGYPPGRTSLIWKIATSEVSCRVFYPQTGAPWDEVQADSASVVQGLIGGLSVKINAILQFQRLRTAKTAA